MLLNGKPITLNVAYSKMEMDSQNPQKDLSNQGAANAKQRIKDKSKSPDLKKNAPIEITKVLSSDAKNDQKLGEKD